MFNAWGKVGSPPPPLPAYGPPWFLIIDWHLSGTSKKFKMSFGQELLAREAWGNALHTNQLKGSL